MTIWWGQALRVVLLEILRSVVETVCDLSLVEGFPLFGGQTQLDFPRTLFEFQRIQFFVFIGLTGTLSRLALLELVQQLLLLPGDVLNLNGQSFSVFGDLVFRHGSLRGFNLTDLL